MKGFWNEEAGSSWPLTLGPGREGSEWAGGSWGLRVEQVTPEATQAEKGRVESGPWDHYVSSSQAEEGAAEGQERTVRKEEKLTR